MLRKVFLLPCLLLLVSGCSPRGNSVASNSPAPSVAPSAAPSNAPAASPEIVPPTFAPSPAASPVPTQPARSQSQLSRKDESFLDEIERYARQNGKTFTDVSAEQNINNAKTLCSAVERNGASTSFNNYIQAIASSRSDLTHSDGLVVGYFFSASIRTYCPQYLPDVKEALAKLKSQQRR